MLSEHLIWYLIGIPVVAYLAVRFASAAYFKSKQEFLNGKPRA